MFCRLSLCLITLLVAVGTHSGHDDLRKVDTCGETVSGLRSCIWLDSQELGAPEKVLVHYKIQNVSDGEIFLWKSGFWPNNTIVVLNDRGESVKLTKEGRRIERFIPREQESWLQLLKSPILTICCYLSPCFSETIHKILHINRKS